MIETIIKAADSEAKIQAAINLLQDGRPLFMQISQALEYHTEQNFEAQGRPSWAPLSRATVKERMKRNRGSSVLKTLQDRGILASSISSEYGADFSLIGAGGAARDYAAIHQFGGTIDRPAHSVRTRLRTDRKGNLVRQGDEGRLKNLAVFAKENGSKPHKLFRESWHQVDAYSVTIPSRPYLPFTGSSVGGTIQPEAANSILDIVAQMVGDQLS